MRTFDLAKMLFLGIVLACGTVTAMARAQAVLPSSPQPSDAETLQKRIDGFKRQFPTEPPSYRYAINGFDTGVAATAAEARRIFLRNKNKIAYDAHYDAAIEYYGMAKWLLVRTETESKHGNTVRTEELLEIFKATLQNYIDQCALAEAAWTAEIETNITVAKINKMVWQDAAKVLAGIALSPQGAAYVDRMFLAIDYGLDLTVEGVALDSPLAILNSTASRDLSVKIFLGMMLKMPLQQGDSTNILDVIRGTDKTMFAQLGHIDVRAFFNWVITDSVVRDRLIREMMAVGFKQGLAEALISSFNDKASQATPPAPPPRKTENNPDGNPLLVKIPAGKYHKAYLFVAASQDEYDYWMCCAAQMAVLDAWLVFQDDGHKPKDANASKKYSVSDFLKANPEMVPKYLQLVPPCPCNGVYWFDFSGQQPRVLYCSVKSHTGFMKSARKASDTDSSKINITGKKAIENETTSGTSSAGISTPAGAAACKQNREKFQRAWCLWRTSEGYDNPDRKNPSVKPTLQNLMEYETVLPLQCPDGGKYDVGTADIPPSCSVHGK